MCFDFCLFFLATFFVHVFPILNAVLLMFFRFLFTLDTIIFVDAFARHLCLWLLIFGCVFEFLGHPEIGTAITKCFEHLENEKHILDPGHVSLTIHCVLNHPLCP